MPEFLIEAEQVRQPLLIDAVQQYLARHPELPPKIVRVAQDEDGVSAAVVTKVQDLPPVVEPALRPAPSPLPAAGSAATTPALAASVASPLPEPQSVRSSSAPMPPGTGSTAAAAPGEIVSGGNGAVAAPLVPDHPKLAGYLAKINGVIDTVRQETALPPDSNGWTFNSRQKDIDIYTKTVGQANLSKGIGIIPMPALLVHYVFSDLKDRKQWDDMFESGADIETIDESLSIVCTYFKMKAPMFITARDLLAAGRTLYQPDGSIWMVSCSVEHEKGMSRGGLAFFEGAGPSVWCGVTWRCVSLSSSSQGGLGWLHSSRLAVWGHHH